MHKERKIVVYFGMYGLLYLMDIEDVTEILMFCNGAVFISDAETSGDRARYWRHPPEAGPQQRWLRGTGVSLGFSLSSLNPLSEQKVYFRRANLTQITETMAVSQGDDEFHRYTDNSNLCMLYGPKRIQGRRCSRDNCNDAVCSTPKSTHSDLNFKIQDYFNISSEKLKRG